MIREPAKQPHQRVFRYGSISIGVGCTDQEDLHWLSEFMRPDFCVLRSGSYACRVDLTADAHLWTHLKRLGPDPGQRRKECFFLDTTIVRLPVWRSIGDDLVIFDEGYGVFYIVSARRAAVNIIRADHTGLSRLGLMRVVREFAIGEVHGNGGAAMHGAAFLLDGRGILIAGPKRSGKTSLLLHSLERNSATYVSNDRVWVSLDSRSPDMRGIPTIVNLRASTLQMFPELYSRLRSSSYTTVLSLGEAQRRLLGRAQPWRAGEYAISPAQLCALLGIPRRAQGSLAAIVFPEVTRVGGGIRLEHLAKEEAAARLRDAVFRSAFARKSGSLFSPAGKGHASSHDAIENFAEALASRVNCYVCYLGREAYQDRDWVGQITGLGIGSCSGARAGRVLHRPPWRGCDTERQ